MRRTLLYIAFYLFVATFFGCGKTQYVVYSSEKRDTVIGIDTSLIKKNNRIVEVVNNRSVVELKDDIKWINFEKKEIRALWITTVNNLDWPSANSTPEQQKKELLEIFDKCIALNFNAVILQVRPLSDALYSSSFEPWSHVLTGTQGKNPGYDPLKFAVQEAHKRGLQLHAWINPYRVGSQTLDLALTNVAKVHPDWVVSYNGYTYLNPGLPEVQNHLADVVKDIVTHYDVDAIHFDDYFYPSGIKHTKPFVFDDKVAYRKYGNDKSIEDWRECNVNNMVEKVHETIKACNPNVLFGISPSGRRENSLEFYADPLVWINNRWIDYLAPQIYWEFGHAVADFGTQTAYWNSNANGIAMIVGVGVYKFTDALSPAYDQVDEFDRQIDAVRKLPNLNGYFFFRAKNFENQKLFNFIQTKFASRTLIPYMGGVTPVTVKSPKIEVRGKTVYWNPIEGAQRYAVYSLQPTATKGMYNAKLEDVLYETFFSGKRETIYVVTAISSQNLESVSSDVVTIL